MKQSYAWIALAEALLLAAACRPEFQINKITGGNEALYTASLREYQRHHWDNAVSGFEKLTSDLPARDTLLPRSYWYLAQAHEHMDEHLLAAQSFNRLVETFPDDSVADDAALESARAYRRLWHKPELDATYGETALASYNTLIGLYPNSPLVPTAHKEIGELENWFAIKDFVTGDFYYRKKAYDPEIIYFSGVLTRFPSAPKARDAALRLIESYQRIHYSQDVAELCARLRQQYPSDRQVQAACNAKPEGLLGVLSVADRHVPSERSLNEGATNSR